MKILKNEYTNTRISAHKIIADILNNLLFILYNMCPMLAPFTKLIGKGVQGIVDAIAKRKNK
jgi:hypothetical protein